jgi:hypothetical protein
MAQPPMALSREVRRRPIGSVGGVRGHETYLALIALSIEGTRGPAC